MVQISLSFHPDLQRWMDPFNLLVSPFIPPWVQATTLVMESPSLGWGAQSGQNDSAGPLVCTRAAPLALAMVGRLALIAFLPSI